MSPTLAQAMPVEGLLGGLLIGLSAAIMLLGNGRVAGVSGLVARATGLADSAAPRSMAIAFIVGLPIGAALMSLVLGGVVTRYPAAIWPIVVGGLLVGFGDRKSTRLNSSHQ